MVAAVVGLGSHLGPLLGGVRRGARIAVRRLGATAAARHQHLPVRQKRRVVMLTGIAHRRCGRPGGRGRLQVDDLGGVRRSHAGRGAVEGPGLPSHYEDLPVVVHRGRAPVACPEGVVAHDRPGTGSGRIQNPRGLIWPRVEDLAVRRQEHVRVIRQLKLRVGKGSPAGGRSLPDLGHEVHPGVRVDHSGDDEDVAVGEGRRRRIPARGAHVGQT